MKPERFTTQQPTRLLRVALLTAALLTTSCANPGGGDDPTDGQPTEPTTDGRAPVEAPAPWTEAFLTDVEVVADEIAIEGPAGLRTHTAVTRDDVSIDYDQRVTEEGLVQTHVVKPGATIPAIEVTIDRWTLYALERVVVTERPTNTGEVVVRATGRVVAETPQGRIEDHSFVRRYRVGTTGDSR